MNGSALRIVLAVLVATVPLAACGKKGPPGLPAGEKSTYPHPYPSAAPSQNATSSVPGSDNARGVEDTTPLVPPGTQPSDLTTPPDDQSAPAKPNP
jgi:predicted small lipoprotein YifL